MASLRLITLGAPRLVDADGRDVAHGQRKLLALLAYVARRAPRPVTREELAALMWGERPEENARASLRQALFQLKRSLGDVLDVTAETAALRPGGLAVDAAEFEADVIAGRYREAGLRWTGEFLLGAEDAGGESFRVWLEGERARLRRLFTRALEELTGNAAGRGAWAEAVTWAERWADMLPLDERPHRRLVELLSLAGRATEALARHAGYGARVRAEFGRPPSEEFLRLGAQLERQTRASAATAPARGNGSGSGTLRAPEMVGREGSFAELTAAWHEARRGRATVVVLEGDAGVGKTRLADEFLRTVEPRRNSFVVLRARAYDADHEVRLALTRELLAPLRDAPGLLGAPRAALAELARLVPGVREQIRDLPGPSDYARALDEAIARILTDVAAEAPVLMFVDDLPRTDPESRRLVLSIARRLPWDARVLMLLTSRTGEMGRPEELRDLRGLRRVHIEPLPLVDVEALLSSMAPLAPEAHRALAERLVAETGGVASTIVDTIMSMVDDRHLVPDANGTWRLAAPGDARPAGLSDFVSRALRGRFTTERILYKGGALTTYAAIDARGRRLELHVPNRRVATPVEADHFLRTLERVAGLDHAGILPVADYGATAGVLFFATRPVEEESLRERLAEGRPLPIDESVRIASEVARALAQAHAHGVHHHDLRPKNVLLTPAGTVLARVGIAEALVAAPSGDGTGGPDDTGVLIGAPAYLSPEQLADEGIADARSDIYSLGCLLYEMLAGEPPFGGRSRGLIARKLTESPPSVRTLRDSVPEPLERIVGKALARVPAERYPSAEELADALEGVRAAI